VRAAFSLVVLALAPLGATGCAKPCGCVAVSSGYAELSAGHGAPLTVAATEGGYIVTFGDAVALGQEAEANLLLTNDGIAALQVLSVEAPSDPEFTVVLDAPITAQPGVTLTAVVSFKPTSTGQRSAALTLNTDSATTPTVTLNLVGTGTN
jgi:hypothetical protein